MNNDIVLLVNQFGKPLEYCDKTTAHEKGLCHIAFSIFIFNSKKNFLIQKRSKEKYHSPSLWSNTCCSHPLDIKTINEFAIERLQYEMGITVNYLYKKASTTYNLGMDNGMIEHEYNYIYEGYFDEPPKINLFEVDDWKWATQEFLEDDIKNNPSHYTSWFKFLFLKYYTGL